MRLRLWRAGLHHELTRAECAEMREADAWSLAHPIEVRALECYVGRVMVLVRDFATYATEVREGARGVPLSHACGAQFNVRMRVRDRLLVRALGDGAHAYLLRREWLRLPLRAPRRLAL